jgi:hypothetical protein
MQFHAPTESPPSRSESPRDLRCYRRGTQYYRGSIKTAVESTCCQSNAQRAQSTFQDDLLVRSPRGFGLTLRGRKILEELNSLLPSLEQLVVDCPMI